MTSNDVILFVLIAIGIAIPTHRFNPRYWSAAFMSALGTSIANIIHELFVHDFVVRPADAFFWIPMTMVEGVVLALPITLLVGLPFYLVRRRKARSFE